MTGVLTRIGVAWHSHNGLTWNLMTGTEGAILTSGLDSIHLPSFKQITYRTARTAGVRFGGIDWDAGEMTLGVTVADTWVNRPAGDFRRGDLWLSLDREFRNSFCPYHVGEMEFEVLGETRKFRGRLLSLERSGGGMMPDVRGKAEYEITLASESPFYEGRPVVYDFPYAGSGTDDTNYYGPNNAAPDFVISPGNAVGNASVTNPGQVETWPRWTVDGPGRAVVGIGNHLTTTEELAAGERLVIDTDPATGGVYDGNGNRAWDRLGPLYDFAPIDHSAEVTATAQLIGGGPGSNIRLEIPARYRSAY